MKTLVNKYGVSYTIGGKVLVPSHFGSVVFEISAMFPSDAIYSSGLGIRTHLAKCPCCNRLIEPPFNAKCYDSAIFVPIKDKPEWVEVPPEEGITITGVAPTIEINIPKKKSRIRK